MESHHYLIGNSLPRFIVSRRPLTLRKLLQNMAFENIKNAVPLKDSVKLVVKNAMVLWKQCKVDTIRSDHIEEKLEKEYLEWQRLKRNKHQTAQSYKDRCKLFEASLDVEFDVKKSKKAPVTAPSHSPDTASMTTEQSEEQISFEIEENQPTASGSGETKKRKSKVQTRAQKKLTSEREPHIGESK